MAEKRCDKNGCDAKTYDVHAYQATSRFLLCERHWVEMQRHGELLPLCQELFVVRAAMDAKIHAGDASGASECARSFVAVENQILDKARAWLAESCAS